MLQRIDHVNLVVDDLPRMTSFYRDALGLRVTKQVTISGHWIETVANLDHVEADVVYLEADAGAGLELILYRSPEGSRPDSLGDPNTKGIRHIAFRVEDLDAVVSSLKASGVAFFSDIQQVPAAQVDFASLTKRIAYCRDPEGNLLELCSFQ